MSFYRYHIFFCTNQRQDGRPCCGDHDATALRNQAKAMAKELGLDRPGGVRVNSAGCLNRCGEGPVAVVYPEGVWYRYRTSEDVSEIVNSHLAGGTVVERLRI